MELWGQLLAAAIERRGEADVAPPYALIDREATIPMEHGIALRDTHVMAPTSQAFRAPAERLPARQMSPPRCVG